MPHVVRPLSARPGAHRAGQREGNAGFTMLEVLAAFLILALLTVAIQQGLVVAASGISRAEAQVGADLVAGSLMSGPMPDNADALGETSGRLNGYDWTMRTEPLALDELGGDAKTPSSPWSAVRLKVEVRQAGRSPILAEVETVRLVRAAPEPPQ